MKPSEIIQKIFKTTFKNNSQLVKYLTLLKLTQYFYHFLAFRVIHLLWFLKPLEAILAQFYQI